MARFRDLKNNYTSGELDPSMYARADNKHYFNGASKLRNVIVLPQGGWRPRKGTAYVDTVPPNSDTGAVSRTRLIPHVISTLQTYMVLLHHRNARIYKNRVLVDTITGQSWESGEMRKLGWTQNLDTLLLFQNNRQPRAIQRQGADNAWASFNWGLTNVPNYAFPDTTYVNGVDEVQELVVGGGAWFVGAPFTLTLGGEETERILYTTVQATMATRIQNALRALSVTGTGITCVYAGLDESGVDAFTVTMAGDDGDQPWGEMVAVVKVKTTGNYPIWVTVTTKGRFPGEDSLSNARGWPRCGCFFQGRLAMAGSTQRPDTMWMTRSGDLHDLNTNETADDYAIEITADADDLASFHQIFVGRHLQLFASSGEYYVPISDTDPVTPTNVSLRRTTSRGSKDGLPVFDIEGATCFVQAARKLDATTGQKVGVALRELIFADTEQAYQANPLSLLSAHMIKDPLAIAVKRSTGTDTSDYVLMVNATDTTLTTFCTIRSQEVNAFTLFETDGEYRDVGVDGDDVYFVIMRDVNGVNKGFLEVEEEGLFVDCAVYDFDVGAPVSVVSVAHLIGETVKVYVDGFWRDDVVVPGSGNVTLDPPAESEYQIGKAWPVVDEETGFVYCVEDLPPAIDGPDGPIFGKRMRIPEVTLSVDGLREIIVNGNRITNAQFQTMAFDTPAALISGNRRIRGMLGWGEGRVKYGNTLPGPGTVRGVLKKVAA